MTETSTNPHSDAAPESHSGSDAHPTPSQLAATQARIAELEAQLAQLPELKEKEARYLYLYADFENFKKRAAKERTDLIKFGWEPVARDLLEVLDNLDRAVQHIPPGTDKNLTTGLQMVMQQFRATLEKQGVQKIEALGKPFDPNFHEAVASQPSDEPADQVIQEQQAGYTLHGRLLRPSQVVVSTGKN
jgi:molecular chaperone GrpE